MTSNYIARFKDYFDDDLPWLIIQNLEPIIFEKIKFLSDDFEVNNGIAIHKTAIVEKNAILKAPLIIEENCFVAANACLRNGVFLSKNVKIGMGVEIKSSIISNNSAVAHFNFIGDSIIGENVNFEAGSITANHFNERENKEIFVKIDDNIINTQVVKFGSLIGDYSKIGANAVLSPGTILKKNSVVKRLELIEQIK
jgi:NDP-sugar pyrophosphorylase family protein